MKQLKKKNTGFTLLELLLVVVIIGILATLAIPRFFITSENARASEARGVLGAIYRAEQLYFAENQRYTTILGDLFIDDIAATSPAHYYVYTIAIANAPANNGPDGVPNTADDVLAIPNGLYTATATRKVASANNVGRAPMGPSAYLVTIDQTGALNDTKVPR